MKLNLVSRNKSVLAATLLLAVSLLPAGAAIADDNELVSQDIATMFRAARAVISKNQGHINDPSVGDKNLSGDVVIAATKANYATATGRAFNQAEAGSLQGQAQTAMFDAIAKVMSDAQPLINEQGTGFKGFLPAIFARQLATQFTKSMSGAISIKLTAPKSYVRNRQNRPDGWESTVIEDHFKAAGYETGRPYFANADYKGKPAFRFILPEYYGESCLACHGEPKGDLDITGAKKEGGRLGELGGAISVVIAL